MRGNNDDDSNDDSERIGNVCDVKVIPVPGFLFSWSCCVPKTARGSHTVVLSSAVSEVSGTERREESERQAEKSSSFIGFRPEQEIESVRVRRNGRCVAGFASSDSRTGAHRHVVCGFFSGWNSVEHVHHRVFVGCFSVWFFYESDFFCNVSSRAGFALQYAAFGFLTFLVQPFASCTYRVGPVLVGW